MHSTILRAMPFITYVQITNYNIHAYIHTYIHTYIHMYVCIYPHKAEEILHLHGRDEPPCLSLSLTHYIYMKTVKKMYAWAGCLSLLSIAEIPPSSSFFILTGQLLILFPSFLYIITSYGQPHHCHGLLCFFYQFSSHHLCSLFLFFLPSG